MKLHLPSLLRRSLLALMASAAMLPTSATVSVSDFAPVGQYYSGSYDKTLKTVIFKLTNKWKTNTSKTYTDSAGNKFTATPYYNFSYADALVTQTVVDWSLSSSGTYSSKTTYVNRYTNVTNQNGLGTDYKRICSTSEENPGVWILSPDNSPESAVYFMRNYRDITIESVRQQYCFFTPVAEGKYQPTVYDFSKSSLVSIMVEGRSQPTAVSSVGFNLDVADSNSFTYKDAYTAGTGSFSSGTHTYTFNNVKNIEFSDNHAGGSGGLIYGANWDFSIDTAENVRFIHNVSDGVGSVGYAAQSSVWSGDHKGGLQIHHVTGEVLFDDNDGSCVFRNVSAGFSDINKLIFTGNSGQLFQPYNSVMYVEMEDCNEVTFSNNGSADVGNVLYNYASSSIYDAGWTLTNCGNVNFTDNKSLHYLSAYCMPQMSNVNNVVFSGNHSYDGTCITRSLTIKNVRDSLRIVSNVAESDGNSEYAAALFAGTLTANGAEGKYADIFQLNDNRGYGYFSRGLLWGGMNLTRFKEIEIKNNGLGNDNRCISLFGDFAATAVGNITVNGNILLTTAAVGGLFYEVDVSDFDTFSVTGNRIEADEQVYRSFFGIGTVEGKLNKGVKQSSMVMTDNQMRASAAYRITDESRGGTEVSQLASFLYSGNSFVANEGASSTSLLNNTVYLTDINSVRIVDNASVSADRIAFAGGIGGYAHCITPDRSDNHNICLQDSGEVVISGNHAEGKTGAYGGGIFSNNRIVIADNNSVTISGNWAKADKIANVYTTEGRKAFEGQTYTDNYGNGAWGGGLFAEEISNMGATGLGIYNNAHFVSRGNYVTDGTTYQLQGIATTPEIRSASGDNACTSRFAAPAGATMELYDGLYIGGNLEIGLSEYSLENVPEIYSETQYNLGNVLFSGKYAAQDLAAIKQAAGAGKVTAAELEASTRYDISTDLTIQQGSLEVSDGARLYVGNTIWVNGNDAKVSVLRQSQLCSGSAYVVRGNQVLEMDHSSYTSTTSVNPAVICIEKGIIRVDGTSEMNIGRLVVADGGTLSLNVAAENKTRALLTLNFAPSYWAGMYAPGMVVGGDEFGAALGTGYLELTTSGSLAAGDYILLSFNKAEGGQDCRFVYNPETSNWLSGQAVTGMGKGDTLRLVDNATGGSDLVWHVAKSVAPAHRAAATLTWSGASGTWKNDTLGSWTSSVSDLKFYDGDQVVFGSAATVSISGAVAPTSVTVKNASGLVSFSSSDGGSITGTTSLNKSGAGNLTINTANTYSGGTAISAGTVTAGHAAAFGIGGITLSGGTLAMGTQAVANAVTATGGTLTGTAYKGALTVKGNVTLGSGFKAGSLTLASGTLTGTVKTGDVHTLKADGGRISGALTLNGGSIVFGGSPLSVSGALTISSSTVLDFSAYSGAGQYTLISAGSVSGNLSYLNYDSTVGRNAYSVVKSGNSLVLKVETAAATLVWNAPYGVWCNNGSFGDAVFGNGDLVQFGTQSNVIIKGPVNPGSVLVNADRNVVFTADRYTPGSGITGSATLTKEGAGMLTLNAGNTYSGGTILKQGTLKAAADTAFGTGAITVKGGTLDLGGKAVTNDIVLAGNALLKGDAKYTGALSVQGQATLLGKMANKATLTIGSGSTLTLAPTATVAGNIDVWNGTLNISSPRGITVARGSFLSLYDGTVNGGVSVGTGGVLILHGGTMTTAPTLTGGVLVGSGGHTNVQLSGTGTLLLDSQYVCLKGKGTLVSDSAPTVTGGKLTLQSLHDAYFDEINVDGGMLALGRVNTDLDIHVTGSAALNNGAFHSGDVNVDGELLKGSVIKLTNSKQSVDLNAAGVMNGTISGLGVVNVNDDINASLGKMTNAAVNLNSGTLTNIKGMKLVKGQTLTFGGGNLNLSGKLLTTVVGSTLSVTKSGKLDGNLTMAGGTLVLKNGATLTVNGALTLTKPTELVINGTTTIKCNQFNGPRKGTLEEFFGVDKGITITQKGNTLTFSGYSVAACAASEEEEPETVAAYVPVTDASVALAAEAAAARPLGDALVMADWAIVDANRAFTNTLQSRRDSGVMLADGQGMAWASAMGGVSRHGSENGHNGADVNMSGAAVGVEQTAGKNSTLGLAVGHTWSRIGATGMQHLRQDTAHVALYGSTKLPHGFTAEWTAAYGDTDSKGTFNGTRETWSQKSTAISARLSKSLELNDSTAVRGFAGINYDATDAASIHGMHTGSIQRLQGEVGAGITHRADKLTTYAEASVTTDLARNAPAVDFGAWRQNGATPGRTGLNLTLGAAYELTDKWSINAAYHLEAAERATQHSFNVGAGMKF